MIVKLGLTNIRNLMKELGDAQEKLRILHIAGTNGKGSTGAFLESVLIEAGYKVGRYTSPAVFEPLEVWRINRENISEADYQNCLKEVNNACERMVAKGMEEPSPFERETALAFVWFYQQKCDYVLLEVGMGGETDATNVMTKPVCSVITSVSMDHMQYLGNSLAEIARFKAGIIKEGCPVVTGDTQKPEVLEVLRQVTAERNKKNAEPVELTLAKSSYLSNISETLGETSFSHALCNSVEGFHMKLMGGCQLENVNLAITVCKEVLGLPDEVIAKGIEKTIWRGRFEILAKEPLFIIDGAHNEDAAEKLFRTLEKHFTNRKITYIIGVLADKEYQKILAIMLPAAGRVLTVTPDNERALPAEVLAAEVRRLGKEAVSCLSVDEAVSLALEDTAKEDVIVAFGSLSYLAEVKAAVTLCL